MILLVIYTTRMKDAPKPYTTLDTIRLPIPMMMVMMPPHHLLHTPNTPLTQIIQHHIPIIGIGIGIRRHHVGQQIFRCDGARRVGAVDGLEGEARFGGGEAAVRSFSAVIGVNVVLVDGGEGGHAGHVACLDC